MLTSDTEEYSTPPKNGECKGKPVEWFYPDARTRGITPDMLKAISACRVCHVQYECREYGLRHEIYGIWGGLTEKQRVAIRKERKISVMVPGFAEPVLTRGNQ